VNNRVLISIIIHSQFSKSEVTTEVVYFTREEETNYTCGVRMSDVSLSHTMHCITLHCTVLHWIALHCITLHYIALRWITFHDLLDLLALLYLLLTFTILYIHKLLTKSKQVLVPIIHSFVVLDADGERLLAKYYEGRTKAEQQAFESMINKKTINVPAKVDGIQLHLHSHFYYYYYSNSHLLASIFGISIEMYCLLFYFTPITHPFTLYTFHCTLFTACLQPKRSCWSMRS
jgi:hypothetical protein